MAGPAASPSTRTASSTSLDAVAATPRSTVSCSGILDEGRIHALGRVHPDRSPNRDRDRVELQMLQIEAMMIAGSRGSHDVPSGGS